VSSRWTLRAGLAVALVPLALLAAGCGGSSSSSSGSTTTSSSSTTGTTAGSTTLSGNITFDGVWTGNEAKNFGAVIAAFNKLYPKVKVNYKPVGDNLPTVLSTAVAGGNPPDMADIAQPGLVKQFVDKGALKPIGYATTVFKANFSPAWVALGTFNSKIYGLVFKASNKSTVWYNVKAFKDAGVTAPKTWPKFLATARTIRASGLPPFSIAASNGWTLTDLFENIYLRTAGKAKYDLLTAHKIKWTDPSVKAALKVMGAVFASSNMVGGTSGALQTDFPTSVNNALAASPKGAMVIEADFVPTAITDTSLKAIKDYNEFAFPTIGKSSPATVLAGGDVVVMFKNNPANQALVKYLATPQAATIWAQRGGYTSANKNVKPSAYGDALNRKTAVALALAKVTRFDMSDQQPAAFGSTVGQGEWKIFQDLVQSPKNVNKVAAALEASAKKAYGK
jgi:alpha-glucoside transport system substrate-binding protein